MTCAQSPHSLTVFPIVFNPGCVGEMQENYSFFHPAVAGEHLVTREEGGHKVFYCRGKWKTHSGSEHYHCKEGEWIFGN